MPYGFSCPDGFISVITTDVRKSNNRPNRVNPKFNLFFKGKSIAFFLNFIRQR